MQPFTNLRYAAVAAVALMATSVAASAALAQSSSPDKAMQRSITVSATGTVQAAPDQARIASGVVSEADTAAKALAANTGDMTKLIGGLKEAGVDGKDIQTSSFRIEPRYTNPQDGRSAPTIDGYRVVNEVSVLVRDVANLGGILDALVKLGANQMNGLSFEVSKADTLKDDARREAVANARRRAELLATAANATLGDVVTISEDVVHEGPRPFAMAKAARADSVPIESGTETLEARVTITWALK